MNVSRVEEQSSPSHWPLSPPLIFRQSLSLLRLKSHLLFWYMYVSPVTQVKTPPLCWPPSHLSLSRSWNVSVRNFWTAKLGTEAKSPSSSCTWNYQAYSPFISEEFWEVHLALFPSLLPSEASLADPVVLSSLECFPADGRRSGGGGRGGRLLRLNHKLIIGLDIGHSWDHYF